MMRELWILSVSDSGLLGGPPAVQILTFSRENAWVAGSGVCSSPPT